MLRKFALVGILSAVLWTLVVGECLAQESLHYRYGGGDGWSSGPSGTYRYQAENFSAEFYPGGYSSGYYRALERAWEQREAESRRRSEEERRRSEEERRRNMPFHERVTEQRDASIVRFEAMQQVQVGEGRYDYVTPKKRGTLELQAVSPSHVLSEWANRLLHNKGLGSEDPIQAASLPHVLEDLTEVYQPVIQKIIEHPSITMVSVPLSKTLDLEVNVSANPFSNTISRGYGIFIGCGMSLGATYDYSFGPTINVMHVFSAGCGASVGYSAGPGVGVFVGLALASPSRETKPADFEQPTADDEKGIQGIQSYIPAIQR